MLYKHPYIYIMIKLQVIARTKVNSFCFVFKTLEATLLRLLCCHALVKTKVI